MINYSIPTITQMPSQFFEGSADENEATKHHQKLEYYRQWALWVAQHYNRPNNNLGNMTPYTSHVARGLADSMYRNYAYYLGMQGNEKYKFSETNEKGEQIGTNMIPGQKITSLIEFIHGKMIRLVDSLEVTVKAISKDAIERKSLAKEKLELLHDQRELLAQLEELGVSFKPEGADEVKSKDDIEEYITSKQEAGEIWYNDIANDIWYRNQMAEKAATAGGVEIPVLGTTAFHVHVQNGREIVDLPNPINIVWDLGNGFDRQNRKMRFGAVFNGQLTPSQIIDMYGEKLEANYGSAVVNQIKTATSDNYKALWPEANFAAGNFEWLSTSSNMITMSVCRAYWIADDELEEENGTLYYEQKSEPNKYGYKPFIKVKDAPKKPGTCVYQADIIGGLFVVNAGKMPNQVYDEFSAGSPIIPLFVYNSRIALGQISSITDQLIQCQQRLDFINNEITNLLAVNLGKLFVFRASQIGDTTVSELFDSFRSMRIAVVNDADGDTLDKTLQMGQAIDLTQSAMINEYVMLRKEEEGMMENIINLSQLSMGQQDGYVSQGVQSRAIDQNSSGTAYLYHGFTEFLQRVLQFATNQAKIIYSMGDEDVMLLGKDGVKYIKENQNQTLESYGLFIRLTDSITDAQRKQLLEFSLMLVQNNGIGAEEMIDIFTAKTFSRLKLNIKKAISARKAEQKEAQQLADLQQQVLNMQNNEAQMAMNSERVATASEDNAMNNEVKLATEMIKADSKGQAAA